MTESAEKMLTIGFSQIRSALTQLDAVSRLLGIESMIVSVTDDEDVLEITLKDVIESIKISIDFEQKRKLPHMP